MIHIYHGEGKGKTTCSVGLAVRAAGSGMRVLFVQFFKDGSSAEIGPLSSIEGITVRHPNLNFGRFVQMNSEQKEEITRNYSSFLHEVILHAEEYDLIVLDEIISTYEYNMVDRQELLDFLKKEGQQREIVLTGRHPAPELVELADYVTEMRKDKHPFDFGIPARKGIEY